MFSVLSVFCSRGSNWRFYRLGVVSVYAFEVSWDVATFESARAARDVVLGILLVPKRTVALHSL